MTTVSSVAFVALLFMASAYGLKHVAKLGEVPYLVAIWQVMDSNAHVGNVTDFHCVGALLTSTHVLTTATCIELSENGIGAVASAGIVNLEPTAATRPIFHSIVEVIKHEDYNPSTRENDLAILTVSPGFEDEDNVLPVSLSPSRVAPGAACVVAGWQYDFYFMNDDLHVDEVEVLKDWECLDTASLLAQETALPSIAEGERISFAGEKLCVGNSEPKECIVGDEGGPLVCDGYLVGLYSSYGLICLETSPEPSLFHDLDHYRDWIRLHVAEGKTRIYVPVVINSVPNAAASMAKVSLVLLLAGAAVFRI